MALNNTWILIEKHENMKNYRIVIDDNPNTVIPLELQRFNLQNVGLFCRHFRHYDNVL